MARALNLPIDTTLDHKDIAGFVSFVQGLSSGETLCVAWQHGFLAALVDAMGLEGIAPTSYPMSCNYSAWSEPAYAMGCINEPSPGAPPTRVRHESAV